MHERKKDLDLVVCLEDFTVLSYAKLLGTTLLDTGVNIINDVAKGTNFRKSLEKRGKRGVKFFYKVKTQLGGGQNRKRTSVIKD